MHSSSAAQCRSPTPTVSSAELLAIGQVYQEHGRAASCVLTELNMRYSHTFLFVYLQTSGMNVININLYNVPGICLILSLA